MNLLYIEPKNTKGGFWVNTARIVAFAPYREDAGGCGLTYDRGDGTLDYYIIPKDDALKIVATLGLF